MTARPPPENLTRRPSALGSSPARSTSTPACLSSSLYLPIAVSSSSLGTAPSSGSPLIINITRMSCVLLAYAGTSVLDHFHSYQVIIAVVAIIMIEKNAYARVGVFKQIVL